MLIKVHPTCCSTGPPRGKKPLRSQQSDIDVIPVDGPRAWNLSQLLTPHTRPAAHPTVSPVSQSARESTLTVRHSSGWKDLGALINVANTRAQPTSIADTAQVDVAVVVVVSHAQFVARAVTAVFAVCVRDARAWWDGHNAQHRDIDRLTSSAWFTARR